ncbi:MAG: hypothetical protein ACKOCN_03975 [Planctomycetaceae bacterium]
MTAISRSVGTPLLLVAAVALVATPASAGLLHKHGHHEPSCCVEEPTCCPEPCCEPAPCIEYHHHRGLGHKHRHGCCETATYETVLEVTSPETGCTVQVPVCLPVCCDGSPSVHGRCTLFGCGEVCFDWCCGVTVKVRFKKCGDLTVTYCGF